MEMRNWKIAGLLATLVVVLSIPIYYLRIEKAGVPRNGKAEEGPAMFAGSLKCKECHQKEHDQWLNSNHDHAMDVANEKTMLGDFNNATFQAHGVTSRFYRKAGKFFVHTQGPEGKMGDFEVSYTFGWFPLQQYLVPFPGGQKGSHPPGRGSPVPRHRPVHRLVFAHSLTRRGHDSGY